MKGATKGEPDAYRIKRRLRQRRRQRLFRPALDEREQGRQKSEGRNESDPAHGGALVEGLDRTWQLNLDFSLSPR